MKTVCPISYPPVMCDARDYTTFRQMKGKKSCQLLAFHPPQHHTIPNVLSHSGSVCYNGRMKKTALFAAAVCAAIAARSETIFLECERFGNLGGWSVDSQFIDEMGSSYLLAHGLGKPVADASTAFEVKKGGRYNVFVRTKNWTA
ncbi:MAG: hypothetical protein MJ138_08675, partial [Kiritimatiellae bacterium]|nr:hypothetical protein [Kiritimatiellia bacterium]